MEILAPPFGNPCQALWQSLKNFNHFLWLYMIVSFNSDIQNDVLIMLHLLHSFHITPRLIHTREIICFPNKNVMYYYVKCTLSQMIISSNDFSSNDY